MTTYLVTFLKLLKIKIHAIGTLQAIRNISRLLPGSSCKLFATHVVCHPKSSDPRQTLNAHNAVICHSCIFAMLLTSGCTRSNEIRNVEPCTQWGHELAACHSASPAMPSVSFSVLACIYCCLLPCNQFVLVEVFVVQHVDVPVGRVQVVWVVQQLLQPKQDLFHSDAWLPTLTDQGQADLAILKHIWVSESNWKITQWSLRWEVLWELDVYWVHTTLPDCAILSGDFTLPVKEVHSTVSFSFRFRYKSQRMIFSPTFPLFC